MARAIMSLQSQGLGEDPNESRRGFSRSASNKGGINKERGVRMQKFGRMLSRQESLRGKSKRLGGSSSSLLDTPSSPARTSGITDSADPHEGPVPGVGSFNEESQQKAFSRGQSHPQMAAAVRWGAIRRLVHAGHAVDVVEGRESKKMFVAADEPQQSNITEKPAHMRKLGKVAQFFYPYVINPDGKVFITWNLIQSALLFYIAIMTPVRVAFDDPAKCDSTGQRIADLLMDLYFICDLGINMLTGFHEGGRYIDNPQRIASQYVKGGFSFDLVVSFPVAWLEFAITGGQCSQSLAVLRLPRLLRLLRILRILRVLKIFKLPIFKRILSIDPNLIRLVKLLFGMVAVTHVAACAFWWVKRNDPFLDDWMREQNVAWSGDPSLYLISLYFAVATLTTVGYGDVHGVTDDERVYAMVTMFIGTILFALIVSNASGLVANMGAVDNLYQHKMQGVRRFMSHWKVPKEIKRKVFEYYDFHKQTSVSNEVGILLDLPLALRSELCFFMAQQTIARVPLFKKAQPEFFAAIFTSMELVAFIPHEVVFEAGEEGDEMYIVKTGTVQIEINGEVVSELGEGEIFGEVALVLKKTRTATVRTKDYTELYVLHAEDLDTLRNQFPEFGAAMEDRANFKLNSFLEVLRMVKANNPTSTTDMSSDTPRASAARPLENDDNLAGLAKQSDTAIQPASSTSEDQETPLDATLSTNALPGQTLVSPDAGDAASVSDLDDPSLPTKGSVLSPSHAAPMDGTITSLNTQNVGDHDDSRISGQQDAIDNNIDELDDQVAKSSATSVSPASVGVGTPRRGRAPYLDPSQAEKIRMSIIRLKDSLVASKFDQLAIKLKGLESVLSGTSETASNMADVMQSAVEVFQLFDVPSDEMFSAENAERLAAGSSAGGHRRGNQPKGRSNELRRQDSSVTGTTRRKMPRNTVKAHDTVGGEAAFSTKVDARSAGDVVAT